MTDLFWDDLNMDQICPGSRAMKILSHDTYMPPQLHPSCTSITRVYVCFSLCPSLTYKIRINGCSELCPSRTSGPGYMNVSHCALTAHTRSGFVDDRNCTPLPSTTPGLWMFGTVPLSNHQHLGVWMLAPRYRVKNGKKLFGNQFI